MLYEKCFAKIYGNYISIQAGFPSEAFTVIAGAPS